MTVIIQLTFGVGGLPLRTLDLQSPSFALSVIPEFGGKIASLRDRGSGREWLWCNPVLPPREPVYGENYIEGLDSGGWDEIFPTVGPCEVRGLGKLPDHGELVGLPWTLEQHSKDELRLSVTGRCAPYRFTRTIRSTAEGFIFDYELVHLGSTPFPWLWCAHPLIAIEAGMRIRYGDSEWHIPDPESEAFTPSAKKFFTSRGEVSSVSVQAVEGSSLTIHFDPDELPYLGFWRNLRGWAGVGATPYFNLGVEPTTSPADLLSDAVAHNLHRVLAGGETARWSLRLTR